MACVAKAQAGSLQTVCQEVDVYKSIGVVHPSKVIFSSNMQSLNRGGVFYGMIKLAGSLHTVKQFMFIASAPMNTKLAFDQVRSLPLNMLF